MTKEHEPDLSLLGKFVYYYPVDPGGSTLVQAPLPNTDGTPHPGTIYNVRAEPIEGDDSKYTTLVDLRVWAHGNDYGVERVGLFDTDALARPVAVFPEDNKKWLKAAEDERAKQAKAAADANKAAAADADERYTRAELEAMTKQDLCDLADGIGAQADLHMTKDEIVAAILKQQKANG